MRQTFRFIAVLAAAAALAVVDGSALAQPKEKDKDRKEQKDERGKPDKPQGAKEDKDKKPKKAKHQNGKQLAGDKVKKDGQHKLHDNGKHSAFIDVKGGKITGVKVKHAEKGDVPVKKYKTKKNPMTAAMPAGGLQPVSMVLVQQTYLGETWIGYAYYDEWGDEVIYWFPYDMVYDGDTGAIEYIPAY
jgi:hypothetical protein